MSYLNPELHRDWKTNGYLKIPRFFAAEEVEDLQAWVSEISDWEPTSDKWMHHYESTPDGARLSRSENFVPYHTDMKATVTSGKVLAVVSELMEESAVLYKEKINYKYPGGGGYAAHQDAPAYEFVNYHITCLISVDSATAKSGCLYFAPGRHQEGFIALDEKGCVAPETASTMEWVAVPTDPWGHSPFRFLTSHTKVQQIVQSNRDVSSISLTTPSHKATGERSTMPTNGRHSPSMRKMAQIETNKLAKSHIFEGKQ